MRNIAWLIAVTACSPTETAIGWDGGRDPAGDAVGWDAPVAPDVRFATGVVVGAHDVSWSRGGQGCPIARGVAEGPCPGPEPGVVTAPLATGAGTARVNTLAGIATLAGDDTALFFFDIDSNPKHFLVRLRPGLPEDILWSTTSISMVGPVVDATNVYWFGDGALYRASRTGDGSDATALASTTNASQLAPFAGYLYWTICTTDCLLWRVPIAGGSSDLATPAGFILGTSASALYLGTSDQSQILARAANGTTTVAVDHVAQGAFPLTFVANGGELFWAALTGVYRVSAAGAAPVAVPGVTLDAGSQFGVTSDSILYGFTATGYQSIPR